LRLLQRGPLGQLRREHERAEHVAELLDAELVLERLHAGTVHDDAERLQAGGEPAADLLDRAEGPVGGGHREESGLGDDGHTVGRSPGGAGEGVQRRRAVDEDEVVVLLDVGEGLFELPDVADGRVRPVEVDGRGRSDHDVDLALGALRPPRGGDRLTDDLLLRVLEHVRHVEVAGDVDVEAGRDVRLRVEIHHQRAQSLGERGRSQAERHRRLADTTLEGAHAEYMHGEQRYRQ
jgi:hypothetical protein